MDRCDTFITTEARPWERRPFGDGWRMLRVQYGMQYLPGNTLPYFSITSPSNGCVHDAIIQIFPELRDLIPWHLADQNGHPMHYIANSLYWFDMATGHIAPDKYQTRPARDILRDGIVCGVIPSDENILGMAVGLGQQCRDLFAEWLEYRKPALTAAFLGTMAGFGVKLIEMK